MLNSSHKVAATHLSPSTQNHPQPPATFPLPLLCALNTVEAIQNTQGFVSAYTLLSSPPDICSQPTAAYWSNRISGLATCPLFLTESPHRHSPMHQLDVRVALHQHKAAPVPQQGGESRMRDAALDGAVATVVAWCVQVLGHRPAECGRQTF